MFTIKKATTNDIQLINEMAKINFLQEKKGIPFFFLFKY